VWNDLKELIRRGSAILMRGSRRANVQSWRADAIKNAGAEGWARAGAKSKCCNTDGYRQLKGVVIPGKKKPSVNCGELHVICSIRLSPIFFPSAPWWNMNVFRAAPVMALLEAVETA